jgi:hypothetical protein
MPLPQLRCDVLWGQSAWAHAASPAALVERWGSLVVCGGRLAIEDSALLRRPDGHAARAVVRLERLWNCELRPLDAWRTVASRGFRPVRFEHSPHRLAAHFTRQIRARAAMSRLTTVGREAEAWRLAVELARRAILTYFRAVSVRQ